MGAVRVRVPSDAAPTDLRISHRPLAVERKRGQGAELVLQFELQAHTDDEAQTTVDRFQKPLELRVDLAGLMDFGALQLHEHAFFGYWDEKTEQWVSLDARMEGTALVAETDHFTVYGTGNNVGMETGWVPTCNEAVVSLFDGALVYDYPIEAPDGVGGLQPDLSLRYNSRRVDGIVTWVQSDWAGLGWTVDTVEIVRDAFKPRYTSYPGGTPNWNNGYVEWGNQYSLLYKGTRYPLSPIGPNRIGRYHAQDDQFLYIERRNSINCGALPCNGVRSTIRPSTGLSGSVTGLSIVWAIPKTPSSPSIRAGVTILIRLWGAPMASLRAI